MNAERRDPNNINLGNVLEKTMCPVTPGRLEEMYWTQMQSTPSIARTLGFNTATVRDWMLLAGIRTRTVSEARRLAYKHNPHLHDLNRAKFAKMREDGKQGRMSIDKLRENCKRGRRTWNSTRTRISLDVECGWRNCPNGMNGHPKVFRVYPSRLNTQEGVAYCSRHCAASARHFRNRWAKNHTTEAV